MRHHYDYLCWLQPNHPVWKNLTILIMSAWILKWEEYVALSQSDSPSKNSSYPKRRMRQHYWILSGAGVTSVFSFSYLDALTKSKGFKFTSWTPIQGCCFFTSLRLYKMPVNSMTLKNGTHLNTFHENNNRIAIGLRRCD